MININHKNRIHLLKRLTRLSLIMLIRSQYGKLCIETVNLLTAF